MSLKEKQMLRGGNCPEEWLASCVQAFNPDYTPPENEGLSVCQNGEFFKNILQKNPEKILGERLNKIAVIAGDLWFVDGGIPTQ